MGRTLNGEVRVDDANSDSSDDSSEPKDKVLDSQPTVIISNLAEKPPVGPIEAAASLIVEQPAV